MNKKIFIFILLLSTLFCNSVMSDLWTQQIQQEYVEIPSTNYWSPFTNISDDIFTILLSQIIVDTDLNLTPYNLYVSNITSTGLFPLTTNGYDIGSEDLQWNSIYLANNLQLHGAIVQEAKAGMDMLACRLVFGSGSTGNKKIVYYADNRYHNSSHVYGYTTENVSTGETVHIAVSGEIRICNTSGLSDEAELHLGINGTYQIAEPDNGTGVHVGTVSKQNAVSGIILIDIESLAHHIRGASDLNFSIGGYGVDFVDYNNNLVGKMNMINNVFSWNGSVGIGIVSPDDKLHISDTGVNVNVRAETLTAGKNAGYRMMNPIQHWIFQLQGDTDNRFVIRDITNTKTPFIIEPNTADNTLYLDSIGVGIGTTTPRTAFNLHGFGFQSYSLDNVEHGVTDNIPTDIYGYSSFNSPSAGGFFFGGLSDDGITIPLVFVGIHGSADPNDNSPAILFQGFKKDGTGTGLLGNDETVIQYNNNNNILMSMKGDGNIGISTPIPSAKLDVNGNSSFGTKGNRTLISNDGRIILEGNARTKKELIFRASSSVKGASAPADSLRDVGASGNVKEPVISFSKVTQQEIYGAFHPPDDIDNSVNVSFHLMWIPGESWTTGNYTWSLEYIIKKEDVSYGDANSTNGTTTIISETVTPNNSYEFIETEFLDTIDINFQDVLIVHFYRNISDTADDVGEVRFFEAEYTVNSLGSET